MEMMNQRDFHINKWLGPCCMPCCAHDSTWHTQ
jgi:hypothetical protein